MSARCTAKRRLVCGLKRAARWSGRPAAHLVRGLRRAGSRGALPSRGTTRRAPCARPAAYEDVGADGRENDEDAATRMRTFYGITESPDPCEMGARELIVSNWTTVLMIAAALLEHEVLTYDEVGALVAVSDTP